MRLADEPRAEDDVGLALDDRLDELGILRRVVLEVGVLDDDDLAGGVPEPGAQAAPLPWFSSWKTIVRSGCSAASSLEDSRVPSVEQSSTRMICLRIGTAGPGGGSRGCVFRSL